MALSKEAREFFAKEGRKGGKSRAQKMTPEERSESARKAVEARWAKLRAEVKAVKDGAKALEKRAQARLAKQQKKKA